MYVCPNPLLCVCLCVCVWRNWCECQWGKYCVYQINGLLAAFFGCSSLYEIKKEASRTYGRSTCEVSSPQINFPPWAWQLNRVVSCLPGEQQDKQKYIHISIYICCLFLFSNSSSTPPPFLLLSLLLRLLLLYLLLHLLLESLLLLKLLLVVA